MSVVLSSRLFPIVRLRQALAIWLVVYGVFASVGLADDPTAMLRQDWALAKIPSGNVWLVPAEFRLRFLLDELEPLERTILTLQRNLDQLVARNRMLWEENRVRIEALRRTMAEMETDDPKKRKIEQQIRDLKRQAVAPEDLFAVAAVRQRLIEWTNLRLRVQSIVIEIRALHAEMKEQYSRLATDATLADALGRLGSDHRLGPMRQGYRNDLKRLDRLERLVATDWLPVFRQSERVRFGGLLEDRIPVLFSWHESHEPTVLTANMVQAAGVQISEDAPVVVLTLAGRRLTTRRTPIRSLRFGAIQLKDLSVLVLPDDAEDLGAWIGPDAFTDYTLQLDPSRLRLLIASPAETADRRSPGMLEETFGRRGGSVGDRPQRIKVARP